MTNGKIELRKLNLMGYTPETQVYFVQNAGGSGSVATSKFLQAHRKFFQQSLYCGQIYFALEAKRIEKFKSYCVSKGFEVVDGAKI